SRSRGPISIRIGTPFLIHSQFLTPPPISRLSTSTSSGTSPKRFPRSCSARLSHASIILVRDSSLVATGTMMICVGAMRGDKTFVKIENQFGLCPRLSFRFVNSVALLPEKFSCPQKQTRPHLPTNDVCPLIDEDRQIAIRLHPSCVAGADDRFRSRPNHERFCQRTGRFHFSISVHLQPGVGYDGAFFGEAFDMVRFL